MARVRTIRLGSKKSKRLPRFPRLQLSKDDLIAASLLHSTYNNLARDRTHYEGYDLYRTKMGFFAPVKFAMLGQTLVEQKIDPSIYLKVMCRYGKYNSSTFLPHPSFLCSTDALKIFEWLHRRERDKYQFHEDWKNAIRARNDKDIYEALRVSSLMVNDVRKNFGLKISEAVMMLKAEISPWYWAWFIASINRKYAQAILEWLVIEEPDLKRKIMASTKYYVEHLIVWGEVKKRIRKYL